MPSKHLASVELVSALHLGMYTMVRSGVQVQKSELVTDKLKNIEAHPSETNGNNCCPTRRCVGCVGGFIQRACRDKICPSTIHALDIDRFRPTNLR